MICEGRRGPKFWCPLWSCWTVNTCFVENSCYKEAVVQDIPHGRSKWESCTADSKGEKHQAWFNCRSQGVFWSSETRRQEIQRCGTVHGCGEAAATPANGPFHWPSRDLTVLRCTLGILILLVTINGCDCGAISLFNFTNDLPPWCMLCCVLDVHLVKSPCHKTGRQDGLRGVWK